MKKLLVIFAALVVIGASCAGAMAADPFVIGSKAFTEQLILGHLGSLILTDLGFEVEDRIPLGGTSIVRKALTSRQIHGYFEYTGTAATAILKHKEPFSSSGETYQFVRDKDLEDNDLVWFSPLAFNNTYCLMMRRSHAEELGITSLSDLAAHIAEDPKGLKTAVNNEFFLRPDGLRKLKKTYAFKPAEKNILQMESGLIYLALKDGKVDVGLGFATDGRIAAYDFVVLQDDKMMFPSYNPCFVTHKDIFEKHPGMDEPFRKLGEILTDEEMTRLNFEVAEYKKDPRQLAEDFLRKHNIIR